MAIVIDTKNIYSYCAAHESLTEVVVWSAAVCLIQHETQLAGDKMSPGTTAKYVSFAHLNKLLYLTAAWCLTWVVAIIAYYNQFQGAAWLLAGVTAVLALAIVAISKASEQTVILKGDLITLVLPARLDRLVFAKKTYCIRVTTLLAVDIIDRRRCHVRLRDDQHELELIYLLQYAELVASISNLQNKTANI